MLDKSFIEKIEDMVKESTVEIDGKTFAREKLNPIKDYDNIDPIKAQTLTALIDYIDSQPDPKISDLIITIENEKSVKIMSSLTGCFNERICFMETKYNEPKREMDNFISLERFIVMCISNFKMNEDLQKALILLSKVTDSNIKTILDDGITQQVNIKAGISMEGEAKLPPIVSLIPYRTFSEIEQPESKFLLRAKKVDDEIKYALFETDGGAWKNDAISNIRNWLLSQLSLINKSIVILA